MAAAVVAAALGVCRGAADFTVAEVKPHFQCTSDDGRQRVRDYVTNLTSQSTGIIALIQFEFTLPQPQGYTAFGATCLLKHGDPVVVLVNEQQFDLVSGIRDTSAGDYASMPFLSSGKGPTNGSMCIGDPSKDGERGYAGAILRHRASGEEICVIVGTMPHCHGAWRPEFVEDAGPKGCQGRPLLVVADTNAACEIEGPLASKAWSMTGIAKNHSAGWGDCSDPAVALPDPTCCHDISKGHPEARYWYDRTALCGGGGTVEDFHINLDFVCGGDVEHKFTTATVKLSGTAEAATAVYV